MRKLLKQKYGALLAQAGVRIDGDRAIEKCIFPNSMLPSVAQIGKACEGLS